MHLTLVELKQVLSEEDRNKAQGILEPEGYWWEGNVILSVDIDSHDIEPRRVIIRFKDKNNKSYSKFITYKFWLDPVVPKKEKKEEFILPKHHRRR